MLHSTVFKDFISIGVTDRIYKIARQMDKQWAKNGMDGHDMATFLNRVLKGSILEEVKMDPESGEFFCYFKLENEREVTLSDVHKMRSWLAKANENIASAYMEHIKDSLQAPQIEFTSEAQHVKDFVYIRIPS